MKNERIKMLMASGIFIVCILIYNIFSIFIEYFIGTFGVMILFLTVMFLLGMIVHSIIKIFIDKQYRFSIYIFTAIIAIYLLTTQTLRIVGLSIDYSMNRDERLKVVEMIRSGVIEVDPLEEYVILPHEYAYLSRMDGSVMVQEEEGLFKICFFTSGGLYRRNEVVVYASGNGELKDGDFLERISDISKLEDNWFRGKINK